jgi:hypothetical protein
MMFTKTQILRQSVAIFLTVLLLCQTARTGRCACSENEGQCGNRKCCIVSMHTHEEHASNAKCSRPFCPCNTENHDSPVRQCSCQYRPLIGVISQSTSELINLVQFDSVTADLLTLVCKDVLFTVTQPPGIDDAWSALNTCVLFCRFLI